MNIEIIDLLGNVVTSPQSLMRPTGSPTLSEDAAYGDKNCANCGQSGSTHTCTGCKVTDVGQLRVFYCGKQCQEAHWKAHKDSCHGRRRLARAVSLFGEIWTAFEEATFTSNVVFVGQKDGIISLNLREPGLDPRGWAGGSVIRPFPGEMFPSDTSEAIKQAVLFDSECCDVATVGLPLLNVFLKPICAELTEAAVEPRDPALIVHLRGTDYLDSDHRILRVTLPTGEVFAIDFTGAQYGWKETLYSWDTYVKYRVRNVQSVGQLGWGREALDAMLSTFAPDGPERAILAVRKAAMQGLKTQVDALLASQEISARKVRPWPDSAFTTAREKLVTEAKAYLHGILRGLKENGIGRLYYNRLYLHRVTLSAEVASKYDSVWLSDEEKDAEKGNVDALKRIWAERVARIN